MKHFTNKLEARAGMDKERDNLVCLSWWKSFKKIYSNLPAGKQGAYTDFRVSKQTKWSLKFSGRYYVLPLQKGKIPIWIGSWIRKLGLYNLYCKIVSAVKMLMYNSEHPAKSCENLKFPA